MVDPLPSHPKTWLLFGHKTGDNNQLLALVETLGWPFCVKRLRYRPYELLVGRLGAWLGGIDLERSDPLEPPWPDLVLTAGRRNEAAALWIKKQAARAGKEVKVVHVGRPWAPLDRFDLILTTPQYELPLDENVFYHRLPLHRLTREELQMEGEKWRSRLGANLLTVLVGGSSGPYIFDAHAAERLAEGVEAVAKREGLEPVVITSRRTPEEACRVLEGWFAQVFRFGRGENPYLGALALAKVIVVTGDSISMLSEACFTGKPVLIFPFGHGRLAMHPEREVVPRPRTLLDPERRRALLSDLALRFAPRRLRRDVRRIHRLLIGEGRASWLGEPLPKPPPPLDERPDLARKVAERLNWPLPPGQKPKSRPPSQA